MRVLTVTVTEAGYRRGDDGRLDAADPAVSADIAALWSDPGAAAGPRAGAGPLTLVPCDNLPGNGAVLAAVLRDLAAAVDPALPGWLDEHVGVATTMVDRITPEPTDADRQAVLAGTGTADACPVATEPFSEWVLSGEFPGGRPAWESAGAVLTDDVTPFEERKLWLLNGAHSLLAYVGTVRRRGTVVEAVADPVCRAAVEQWWDTAAPYLALPADDVAAYRGALLERFANPRIRHALAQIAADGSQKLPVRFLPVLARERAAGRLPDPVVTVLAAWVLHLGGAGAPVRDVRAGELRALAERSIPAVLAALDPALADDGDLVAAVRDRAAELRSR